MKTEPALRVLVTGATGFLGRNVLQALAARPDIAPIAACRRIENLPAGFAGEVRAGDLLDARDHCPAHPALCLTGFDQTHDDYRRDKQSQRRPLQPGFGTRRHCQSFAPGPGEPGLAGGFEAGVVFGAVFGVFFGTSAGATGAVDSLADCASIRSTCTCPRVSTSHSSDRRLMSLCTSTSRICSLTLSIGGGDSWRALSSGKSDS